MDRNSATYETPATARPLRPAWLALSILVIAAGAILICCLLTCLTILWLAATLGIDGLTDFMQDLRFDGPLKTKVYAGIVSGLYLGVAAMTLAGAAWRGRRDWRSLVAVARVHVFGREAAAIIALTLAYAALVTFVMERMRARHLLISGPTDYVLLGTILINLVILAPIAEELLFRGWLYTGLRHRFAFWPSFVVTAILFAAIHYDANHRRFLLVLPLAVALGLLRERTGSIKPTILLHAVYNLVIVVITLAET